MTHKWLHISEVFYSFQGESTFMGVPTLFIRLQGCNLRCKICDTKHSVDKRSRLVPIDKIIKLASKLNSPYVCITGGEPLLQISEINLLISKLLKMKKIISIETNGSISINKISKKVKRVVDVKTPSTSCVNSFNKDNLKYLTNYDEIKFFISNKKDFGFANKFIIKNRINKIGCTILMSPDLSKKRLANDLVSWILKSKQNYIFQPQLHKLIKEEPLYLIERA